MRGLSGLTRYYRKFILRYGQIAEKDSFRWFQAATATFERLKEAVTPAPILILPDFTEFIIERDASGGGLGVVFLQDKRLVAFNSKALHRKKLLLSAHEKEMTALVLPCLNGDIREISLYFSIELKYYII